jgi:hypothetical protein
MDYKITMNEVQLKIMADALEFFTRFLSGHMTALPPQLEEYLWKNKISSSDKDAAIKYLKSVIFPELEPNENRGIGSKEIPATNISYEMYREILVFLEREVHKSTTYNVYKSSTLKTSSEPFIHIQFANCNREKNLEKIEKFNDRKED